MGLLQNFIKGFKSNDEFKEKLKEAQEEIRVRNLVNERQKSSNQREVERYLREKQEEEYKEFLTKIRNKQNKENWKSPHKVLSGKANMMKTDKPILKEKNIFVDKRNDIPLTKKKEMFFKW